LVGLVIQVEEIDRGRRAVAQELREAEQGAHVDSARVELERVLVDAVRAPVEELEVVAESAHEVLEGVRVRRDGSGEERSAGEIDARRGGMLRDQRRRIADLD